MRRRVHGYQGTREDVLASVQTEGLQAAKEVTAAMQQLIDEGMRPDLAVAEVMKRVRGDDK